MRNYWWHWFKTLMPILTIVAIIFSVDYITTVTAQWQAQRQQQVTAVDIGRRAIVDEFESISADIRIFSSAFTLYSAYDPEIIKEQFINFHRNKGAYDQIRFISLNGNEEIRVNRVNGKSKLLPVAKLQNKAKRYYFEQALKLRFGEIYISPLDFNIEDGEVEYPIKPTIRLITPVYNWQRNKVGFVIINYLAKNLIDKFIAASSIHQRQLFLINQLGKLLWMKGLDDKYQWQLGKLKNASQLFPKIWQLEKNSQQGQIAVEQGYYTFTSLNKQANQAVYSRPDWILVSLLDKSELNLVRWQFFNKRWKVYIPFVLLIIVVTLVYIRVKHKHRHVLGVQRYEQRFRQIFERINLAAVIIHQDGQISYCNDKFIKLTGYQLPQLIDTSWVDLLMPEASATQLTLFQSLIDNAELPDDVELELTIASGELRIFSWSLTFFTDPDDGSHCLTLIGSDVTEQLAAKRQIERLSHVVEQSPTCVMVTTVDGMIDYVNPEFTRLTGYEVDEVIGLKPAFLQSNLGLTVDYTQLWDIISAGDTWHGEFCNRKKNGDLYWESASISPLKNQAGEIQAYIALKRNIDQQKKLEAALKCQRTIQQRQAQDAAVGKMAYMIAHDLRNPLSSVKMTMQMLPSLLPNRYSELHELAGISLDQIKYMEEILTSLLVFSRAEAIHYQRFDINQLIESVIATEKTTASFGNCIIRYHLNSAIPKINADKVKLQQVLQNIIVNAVQAAQGANEVEPTIKIVVEDALYKNEPYLRILITNNGKSIDPCAGARIFEPFFTTKAKGTGLGLAIVKKNIELHGGEIMLTMAQPGGTLCTVLLPIDHAQSLNGVA